MFARITKSGRNEYLQLVENRREGGKISQRVIATIGRMDKLEASKLFAGVGEYHLDRDNYNEAINFFREALTLNASNTVAQTGLSEALALKGNELLVKDSFPVARTFFEEALKYIRENEIRMIDF